MRDRDSWLNATMIELADTGNGEFDEPVYVSRFAERLAELLGPAEVCLLLPTGHGMVSAGARAEATGTRAGAAVAAGSGDLAVGLAHLEAGGIPGPCTSCYRTGRPIRQLLLAKARTRWPQFTAEADAAGLAACSALPMRRDQETIGAVSVLTASGHVPRSADFRLAQTLAKLATIGILSQRELRQSQRLAQQLQQALDSRVVIEQAKGAVSAWLGVSPADAFNLLRSYARARSLPLAQVAANVLAGTTPAGALVTGAGGARRAHRGAAVSSS
ncbi:MAG TPA: GAF and ANTAR domain-containing protein [Trebonia sp.]